MERINEILIYLVVLFIGIFFIVVFAYFMLGDEEKECNKEGGEMVSYLVNNVAVVYCEK